jgi:tRNA (mo5U34)-methyltransferase
VAITQPDEELRQVVSSTDWYHTLELAPGLTTRGWFDTRRVPAMLPFPASLAGKRCLDIATFDGFWAFEMERRGAEDVTAIDVPHPSQWDWPINSAPNVIEEIAQRKPGAGFEIAHRALQSGVQRLELSVYDLEPDRVGTFDFIYLGSLLLHLRDPVRALEKVRSICRGELMVVDAFDIFLSVVSPRRPVADLDGIGRPWWWKPNLAGLKRMVESAGFSVTAGPRAFWMPAGSDQVKTPSPRALLSKAGRQAALCAWKGDPHAVLRAR